MQLTKLASRGITAWRVRILACALAVMLSVISVPLLPGFAEADVRKADLVSGQTVESRGLTIAQCPNVDAQYVFVMDSNGTVYFERDANTHTKIASVTKVMTCLVALDYGQDSDRIVVSAEAAAIGESSANLQEGDELDFKSMLKALMIPSGNDAALSLAEFYGAKIIASQGGGAVTSETCIAAFVKEMNNKAAAIGMNDSLFANPHGLDDGVHAGDFYSTAHDVGLMVQYGMKNEQFREVCGIDGCEITVSRESERVSVELVPTDTLLSTYEGALGVKTGFTDSAGACFAGASARNGHEVYAIILKAPDEQARFADAETCMDWVYSNYVSYALANSPQTTTMATSKGDTEVPVIAYGAHTGWVDCTIPVTLENPLQKVDVFQLSGNVMQEVALDDISGDIAVGQKVGTITFYQHNKAIATCDLVSCVYQKGPNVLEAIGVAFDRFIRGFTNEQTVAKTQVINTTPILLNKKQ